MSKIKVKEQEFKRIDGKRFEIWARYTTKAEAQAERKRAAQVVRHARVLKDAQGYGIWVDVVRGSPADHLARGGMIQTRMSGGRLQMYRN